MNNATSKALAEALRVHARELTNGGTNATLLRQNLLNAADILEAHSAYPWLKDLLDLYATSTAASWLTGRHPQLGDLSPLTAIRQGRDAEVARLVEQLASSGLARELSVTHDYPWLKDLLELYEDGDAWRWLIAPHKLLADSSPFEAIRDGREADVARIVAQLASGAHI